MLTQRATANHSLIALRAFFNFLTEEGYIDTSPAAGVKKVRAERRIIETFSEEHLQAILATCGRDFTGIRDRAILIVLVDCGMRATELCAVAEVNINWKEQTVTVLGKGRKERVVAFGSATQQALAKYAARRPDVATDRFFISCYGQPLDRFSLAKMVKRRGRKAGINGVRCSPHTFRHTFAISFLRSGGDLFTLQKLLGHSDLTTTRLYCEVSQTDALQRHRQFSPADRLHLAAPTKGRKRIV